MLLSALFLLQSAVSDVYTGSVYDLIAKALHNAALQATQRGVPGTYLLFVAAGLLATVCLCRRRASWSDAIRGRRAIRPTPTETAGVCDVTV